MDIWSAQAAPGDATKRVAWVLDGATQKSMSISAVSDTAITVGWTAAPSANIRMHALILGGSDIDAYLVDFTTTAAVATQDVALPTGWGQPKCTFFTTSSRTTGAASAANDCGPYISFGIDGTKRWASTWRQDDANTTSTIAATQRQRALVTWNDTTYGSLDAEADLTTTGAPTDGFRLSYSDQASQANQVLALALKGTFTVDTASFTAPTAVAPVTQTPVTMTSTPKAAFFAGWSLPTTAAVDQTHTDLVYSYMGAYAVAVDATTSQGNAGVADDDAQGTSVIGGSGSDTYAVQQYVPATTPTLSSRATASFTGNALTLTWDDTDTIARESWAVVFANAVATATTPLRTLMGVGT
jgi:hypothetical protein